MKGGERKRDPGNIFFFRSRRQVCRWRCIGTGLGGVIALLALLLGALSPRVHAFVGVSSWLEIHPKRLIRGSVAVATYMGPGRLKPEKIVWHRVSFPFFKNDRGTYEALLTVPMRQRYNRQFFTLVVRGPGGPEISGFELMAYRRLARTIVLHLKKRERLTPRQRVQIRREREILIRILNKRTPQRLWRGQFVNPVPYGVTSPFGTRRKIHGYMSIHRGTDFRAPTGTPVKAINTGRTVFCGPMVLTGKTVVIDHGKGLYSLYAHLSAIRTGVGRKCEKGQVIGLSGSTGRVTGPHLHLGVFLCGLAVDPVSLIHLRL